jgi:hypothetical protein
MNKWGKKQRRATPITDIVGMRLLLSHRFSPTPTFFLSLFFCARHFPADRFASSRQSPQRRHSSCNLSLAAMLPKLLKPTAAKKAKAAAPTADTSNKWMKIAEVKNRKEDFMILTAHILNMGNKVKAMYLLFRDIVLQVMGLHHADNCDHTCRTTTTPPDQQTTSLDDLCAT